MPKVYPIPDRTWIVKEASPLLKTLYRGKRSGIMMMPMANIMPEHIAKSANWDVEFMVALLSCGAWIVDEWHPLVRMTIAKRLRINANLIFDGVLSELKDQVIEAQLEGVGFNKQAELRRIARDLISIPSRPPKHKAVGGLILSVLDDIQFNSLIQPFHWIRLALAYTEVDPAFGVGLMTTEGARQKMTLCKFLHS